MIDVNEQAVEIPQQTEEISILDDKSKKIIFGLLKSPIAKMMLGNAKAKADGVKISNLHTDNAGIHFTLNDTKTNKNKRVVVTKEDLEQIIRFVLE